MLVGKISQDLIKIVRMVEKNLDDGDILYSDPIIEKQKELLRYQTAPPFKRSVKFIFSEFAEKLQEHASGSTKFGSIHVPYDVTMHLKRLVDQLTTLKVCSQPIHHSLC